ncbi:response regulator transcription factor [Aquisediminimonas sediminicola]|uniref:response regulator transcription factor n=1 Tax=Alteraquisediminimonas sediminicola TaxID=2676787 RepID=UPI001C8DAABE|nr:response regulator transcription factor [Aquisediminimonas sediminicola]
MIDRGYRVGEVFPASVCVVDDDVDFVSFLTRYLEARGCRVMAFASAEAFLSAPAALSAGFFLIDLTLPGADGVDLIGMIRAHSHAGIIVISGRMGPDAFSSALAAGADMFINKPVRFDQVYQAVVSVTRRLGPQPVSRGQWAFNIRSGCLVSPSGNEAALTGTEQKLFARLLLEGGEAVSRQSLAEAADIVPSKDDRNLDAAMFRMRRRIEQQTREPAPIKTIHGSGYATIDVTSDAG